MSGFGLMRFVGARGFLGRLKAGTVTGNDRRSIRRILMGKGLSKSEANSQSHKIVEKSQLGEFAGGRKYRISRFFTSRSVQGILAGVSNALNCLSGGLTAALGGGLMAGALTAGGVHLDRVIVARGLAGRLTLNKRLMVSEKRLLSRIEVQQPAQAPAQQPTQQPAVDPVLDAPTNPDINPPAAKPKKPSLLKRLLSGPLTPTESIAGK